MPEARFRKRTLLGSSVNRGNRPLNRRKPSDIFGSGDVAKRCWSWYICSNSTLWNWGKEVRCMATFIMLSRLSPEGMKTLRNNPERLREVNREVEGFGARVVSQYALLGPYDFITVLEAPDAETVSRVSVELASRATASYETLTAISVEEFSSRLSGEEGRHEVGGSQLTAEPTSTGGGRPESTAPPTEG